MSSIGRRSAAWASHTNWTARDGTKVPRRMRSVSSGGRGDRERTRRAISSGDFMRAYHTSEQADLCAASAEQGAGSSMEDRDARENASDVALPAVSTDAPLVDPAAVPGEKKKKKKKRKKPLEERKVYEA